MAKITFNNNDNRFYQSLKLSVDAYFTEKNIKKTGDWRLFIKTFILLGTALGSYLALMLTGMSGVTAILLCVLFGYTCACIGFAVMHDANHGSYSPNQKLNDFLGFIAANG